jgi:Bacteriophage tail sheath protein
MPVQLSYPGVYVEEVPSGVRAITGVATSITAFVGRAARGSTTGPVTITSFADFERSFGGLWKDSALGFAVRDFFLNGGSTAVIVRLYRPEVVNNTPKRAKATLTLGSLTLDANEEGTWGNSLRAFVDHETRPFEAALGETATSLFNLFVRDGTTGTVEEHRNVVVAPADHPRLLSSVLQNESRLVRATSAMGGNRPAKTGGTIDPGKTVWDDNASATNVKVANAGRASDGVAITAADFDDTGFQAAKQGLYALEKADLFNLLVIPPYTSANTVDTTVVTKAAAYCERRRAMLVLDGLPTWDEAGDVTTAFATGFDTVIGTVSRNAALFFPRLRQPNPLKDNQVEDFAAAGAVAGVMARTDAQRGVWKAPAGLDATLNGVPELKVPLTDGEIGLLNPIGVNCLRAVVGAGRVVWGSRTMQGADRVASEWKYVPVRRTALFLEESLYRGTQWVVFEPNDEPLWAQIRLNVGTFMNNLFRQGAFQGSTPREAYFVKCDRETTTQADIDLGIVNIHVGFAPLKPAEFVVIRLQQIAGQTAA